MRLFAAMISFFLLGLTVPRAAALTLPTLTVSTQQPSGGGRHALAVGFDGTLWAWAENGNSQLGDGTGSAASLLGASVPTAIGPPLMQARRTALP